MFVFGIILEEIVEFLSGAISFLHV